MVRFGNLISIYDFPDLVEQIFINICDMQSRLHEMPQNIHYLQINYIYRVAPIFLLLFAGGAHNCVTTIFTLDMCPDILRHCS